MPRDWRNKSRRSHKHSVRYLTEHSDDNGAAAVRRGPELVPQLPELKLKGKEFTEESSAKGRNNRDGKQGSDSCHWEKTKAQSQSQQGCDRFSPVNQEFTDTNLPSKKRRKVDPVFDSDSSEINTEVESQKGRVIEVSRRKETAATAAADVVQHQQSVEISKGIASPKEYANSGKRSGTGVSLSGRRRRWDKDGVDGDTANMGLVQDSQGDEVVHQTKGNVLAGPDSIGKLQNTEWRLQDGLHNPELKELEKCIHQNRYDSDERDKWLDDDRCEEEKQNHRRHDCQKEDKYKVERHGDDKQKYCRCRKEKYKEDRHRYSKWQDDKSRDGLFPREHLADKNDSTNFKDKSRSPEGHYKENKNYDSDQDYGSYFDEQFKQAIDDCGENHLAFKCGNCKEHKTGEDKCSVTEFDNRLTRKFYLDEDQRSLGSDVPCAYAGDISLLANQQRRALVTGLNILQGKQRQNVKSVKAGYKLNTVEERTIIGKNGARKFAGICASTKEQSILQSKSRAEGKLDCQGGGLTLGVCKSHHDDGRTTKASSCPEIFLKSNGKIIPSTLVQRSPSPSIHDTYHHLIHEKVIQKNAPRNCNDIRSNTGICQQGSRTWHCLDTSDTGKKHLEGKEETGYKEPLNVRKNHENNRDLSLSLRETVFHSPCINQLEEKISQFPPASPDKLRNCGSQDEAFDLSSPSRHVFSAGVLSISASGSTKDLYLDETCYSRLDQTPVQSKRPMGIPLRPQASLSDRPYSFPPVPPLLRADIGNPSVLGPSNSCVEKGLFSINQRTFDGKVSGYVKRKGASVGSRQGNTRKGGGRCNPQSQGPWPNNNFIHFQHPVGGLRPGAFYNMGHQTLGQQYPRPPVLRRMRPSSNMSHNGVHYQRWDEGGLFSGHSPAFGWSKQPNDIFEINVQSNIHTWGDPTSYMDESHIHGRQVWDQNRQGIANHSSDQVPDTWKCHTGNASTDFPTHRELEYQGLYSMDEKRVDCSAFQVNHEKHQRERPPAESIDIKRFNDLPEKGVSEISNRRSPCNAWKPITSEGEKGHFYLSKLDISAELAGLELYNQCVCLQGSKESLSLNNANDQEDMTIDASDDNFGLEVNAEAAAPIHSIYIQSVAFPEIPENLFQRSMSLYRKVIAETKKELIVHSLEDVQHTSQEHLVRGFLLASKGSKEEICSLTNCARTMHKRTYLEMEGLSVNELPNPMEPAVQNDSQIVLKAADLAVKSGADHPFCKNQSSLTPELGEPLNDVNSRELAGDGLLEMNDYNLTQTVEVSGTTSNLYMGGADVKGIENSASDQSVVLDSCSPIVDSVNTGPITFVESAEIPESDYDSKMSVGKHEREAKAISWMFDSSLVSQTGKSFSKGDFGELNATCSIYEDGNQLNEDIYAKMPVEMDDLLEKTARTSELLKSKLIEL